MRNSAIKHNPKIRSLSKAASGIQGLDEITGGGLPRGRPTLVCGNAGSSKTLLAMEFLVRGATEFGEPGVFLTFEETAEELVQNVLSLGFDLENLAEHNKLLVDFVHVERSEIEETGEYDLEGLFIRLGHSIDALGARRVVLDSLETLFGGLSNAAILRAELRRLFRWLKDKGVTAIITGERGDGTLTRHGLEEYVSDCVIVLDHRVTEQLSTRRLRIVKYRGTVHGTNEYPFLIDENGISVLPVTSLGLRQEASDERISTGVPRLDAMLGGKGVYRGSSVLISGTAGTGKTSLAAHFANATCRRGERCLYFAFEESESQLVRNMRSIGLDLAPWSKKGLLRFHATRPTAYGLEMHLATLHKLVNESRCSMPWKSSRPRAGAYVHYTERVEGHKIRERSASFKDHYSQAAMFFRSLSAPEQQHLVEACQFELGKVERKQIREHVLEHFARIDTNLAAAVARGLGLDIPRGKEAPVRAKPSPALSMANTVRDTVKGRRVAVLVAPGVRGQDVLAIKRALDKGGTQLEVVAPALGTVDTDNGTALEATKSLLTVKSVLFDAVVVPGGAASIATLTANLDAREFLSEAYKHFKPIGALGQGTALLRAAGVPGEGSGDTPPRKGAVGSPLGVVVADVAETRAFAEPSPSIGTGNAVVSAPPGPQAKLARSREG